MDLDILMNLLISNWHIILLFFEIILQYNTFWRKTFLDLCWFVLDVLCLLTQPQTHAAACAGQVHIHANNQALLKLEMAMVEKEEGNDQSCVEQ